VSGLKPTASLAIRGAEVIDGSGAPRRWADVLVNGSTIVDVVAPGAGEAAAQFDARGFVLCPGFIDTHTHDDQLVLDPTMVNPKLAQGVTTVVTGNCGISLAPLVCSDPPAPLDILGRDVFCFDSFAAYLQALDDARPALNVVPLIGHISLRVKHLADLNVAATADEACRMAEELACAMEAGAFGLSTGVYYPPARAADTAELLAVCAPLQHRNGLLAMHIRDESDDVEIALTEALHVGKASGARLVISHHKVVGPNNHGRTARTLDMIANASLEQAVCLDCYPYEASSTMLQATKAAKIGHVLVTWSKPHPELSGRTVQSIASEWNVGLKEAAERLMPGGAIYFGMAQQDVDRVLSHPLTMVGSDGLPHDERPHPRLWGTFPRVLGHYSRDRKLFPLEAAIHKMTGLPAQRLGLYSRGSISVGCAADIIVFDPTTVADRATYEQPRAHPCGIEAVFVNGQLAMKQGKVVNVHAGSRLLPGEVPWR
jgi:N-acyl-D-amino-acid deacylase